MSVRGGILEKRGCKYEHFPPFCCRPVAFLVHCLHFPGTARLHCKFSSLIKQIHVMLVRLILIKKIANTVFCNAQKVHKMAVKVHQCPDV